MNKTDEQRILEYARLHPGVPKKKLLPKPKLVCVGGKIIASAIVVVSPKDPNWWKGKGSQTVGEVCVHPDPGTEETLTQSRWMLPMLTGDDAVFVGDVVHWILTGVMNERLARDPDQLADRWIRLFKMCEILAREIPNMRRR